jgi:cytoskeleton-associated protein 5
VGDAKYNAACTDNFLSLAELVSPGFVVKHAVKHASGARNPNLLTGNNTLVVKMIEEFGPAGLPVKEIIDFGVECWGNSNAKVRKQTIEMLSTLYLHLGDAITTFLSGIKDSTRALIDKEFAKITPLKRGEFQAKRMIVDEDVKDEEEKKQGSNDPLESLPRQNVSKEFSGQKLFNLINDKNWK